MSADPKPEGEVSGADKVKSGAENGADGIESGTENKPVHVGDVSEKRRRNVGEDNEAEKSIGEAGNEAISEAENEAIKMTLRQEKILQLIREDNSLSREAISKQLKVSDSSVYRDIEKLKKIGKLERVGGNKGGYWKIK
ncbi:hypothetical protein SDC9_178447 [bioreactor metagenome]|uniref:HTH deoR-type domain-containing protein n=1 Tax=bioreactor metagenome TaxID=1076179 RepID=A0A645GXJ6_9ZZZZ